jgi:hypothetical protein
MAPDAGRAGSHRGDWGAEQATGERGPDRRRDAAGERRPRGVEACRCGRRRKRGAEHRARRPEAAVGAGVGALAAVLRQRRRVARMRQGRRGRGRRLPSAIGGGRRRVLTVRSRLRSMGVPGGDVLGAFADRDRHPAMIRRRNAPPLRPGRPRASVAAPRRRMGEEACRVPGLRLGDAGMMRDRRSAGRRCCSGRERRHGGDDRDRHHQEPRHRPFRQPHPSCHVSPRRQAYAMPGAHIT